MPPSGPKLRGPGGQDIACWGVNEMAVFFGGERYLWSFLLAAVQFPILGVDFLRANSLILDAAAGRLIHSKSLRQILAAEEAVGDDSLYGAYRDLFAEFQRVLNSSGDLPSPAHRVLHQLETTGPPVTAKFRRLDAVKLRAAKEEYPRDRGSFGGPRAAGLPPCTWFPRRTAHCCGRKAITAD